MSQIDTFVRKGQAQFNDDLDRRIGDLLGLAFHGFVSVEIRKPRWMPNRLYRALMRTIVVQSTPMQVRSSAKVSETPS